MTVERRRDEITVRPDGRLWREGTLRRYLTDVDARAPKPVTIERLSKLDPEIAAFAATARGARA